MAAATWGIAKAHNPRNAVLSRSRLAVACCALLTLLVVALLVLLLVMVKAAGNG